MCALTKPAYIQNLGGVPGKLPQFSLGETKQNMDEDQKKCGGISALGIVAILVSLACIGIGGVNIDFKNSEFSQSDVSSTCTVETRIPYYLVVAGVMNIVIIILRLVFQVSIIPFKNIPKSTF